MDFNQIMQMASQVKERLDAVQRRAETHVVRGEAGGGLVRVAMDGHHQLRELHIDPAAIDPKDPALLEDLLRAAFNQASAQLGRDLKGNLGELAQELGLDSSVLDGLGGGGGRGPAT